ncbi:hypothetical protein [Massilia sp. YIM B02443]|nr:hypothetical protein [Massilia sp. YIM B02443]MDN4040189.1 hypothetical protein [Massilia sp. YIM B02443]
MIDASQMPRVPSEVLQQEQQQAAEYVRAPVAAGADSGAGRPPATQGTTR